MDVPTERVTGSAGWAPIETLKEATAGELAAFAGALEMAGGPFSSFSTALSGLAIGRELGDEPDRLDELRMRLGLRRARCMLEADPAARERLETAEQPFWVAVREAVSG